PPHPSDRILTLRHATSIKEEILARSTFFEHFDGVCVDWRYLHERENAALQKESGWLKRQGARLVVDLSSGVDLFPALRLVDNLPADYMGSTNAISDVLAKMETLGARDLILTLHREPENNFTSDQTRAGFTATLKSLTAEAAKRGVTLNLRVGSAKPPRNVAEGLEWLGRVNSPNLKLALSTASLIRTRNTWRQWHWIKSSRNLPRQPPVNPRLRRLPGNSKWVCAGLFTSLRSGVRSVKPLPAKIVSLSAASLLAAAGSQAGQPASLAERLGYKP